MCETPLCDPWLAPLANTNAVNQNAIYEDQYLLGTLRALCEHHEHELIIPRNQPGPSCDRPWLDGVRRQGYAYNLFPGPRLYR